MLYTNLKTLIDTLSGKTRKYQVKGKDIYFGSYGRTVTKIDNMSFYNDGSYRAGDHTPIAGEFLVDLHFLKAKDCKRQVWLPSHPLQQLRGLLDKWIKSYKGSKKLKDFNPKCKLNITNNNNVEKPLRIILNAKHDDLPEMIQVWDAIGSGHDVIDLTLELLAKDLVDILFLISNGPKDFPVLLMYQVDPEHNINDLPFFLDFSYDSHNFMVGHQVVPKEQQATPEVPKPSVEGANNNSFIGSDGQVVEPKPIGSKSKVVKFQQS